jgi:NAD(P)H dehydrogenase (quinone)
MYGHIAKLAEAEKEGLKKAGIEADIFQYFIFYIRYISS